MKRKHPKYQNKKGYKLRYKDHLIDIQENTPKDKLCKRCYEIIDWKLKFGKYKKLRTPRKCQFCQRKLVCKAYRHICDICAQEKKACAKCMKSINAFQPYKNPKTEEIKENKQIFQIKVFLKKYRECSKRKIYRLIDKDLVYFKESKFYFRETEKEVVDLQLKKKYRTDTGAGLFDEDDFTDDSASYKEETN